MKTRGAAEIVAIVLLGFGAVTWMSPPERPVKMAPLLWKDMVARPPSLEQLQSLARFFAREPGQKLSEFRAVVADGETVVTGCEELKGNIFQFTTVSLNKMILESGTSNVKVVNRRLMVTPSGIIEQAELFGDSLQPGTSYVFTPYDEQGRKYTLNLLASMDESSGLVYLYSKATKPR